MRSTFKVGERIGTNHVALFRLHYSESLVKSALRAFWLGVTGWSFFAAMALLLAWVVYLISTGEPSPGEGGRATDGAARAALGESEKAQVTVGTKPHRAALRR